MRAILRNEFYAAYEPGDEHGTILSDGKRYRGQHLAAFSREEWEAIQQVPSALDRSSCKTQEKESAQPPAFAGSIVCADCGGKLGPRKGKHHAYYKDVAHLHGYPCPAEGYLQVRQQVVTEQFGALLQQIPLEASPSALEEGQLWLDASRPPSDETISVPDEALLPEPEDSKESSAPLSPHHFALLPEEEMTELANAHAERLQAGEQLAAIKEAWPTASGDQQREMVQTLLEPVGLQYAVEAERIVGLRPRAPFVPWLEKIPGARREQTDQGIAIVLASHLPPEGRFAEARPGDRDKAPGKLAVSEGASRACEWGKRRMPAQRRPGPDQPAYKIDPVRWPEVLSRIEQGESLRKVARIYQVSHETIRRVVVTVQGLGEKN